MNPQKRYTYETSRIEHVVGYPFPGYSDVAKNMGISAYHAGWALSECPFQPGVPLISGERSSWRYGWLQANAANKEPIEEDRSAHGFVYVILASLLFWAGLLGWSYFFWR